MSYNNLSDGQVERLALLSEELGEAIQAIGKIIRHGHSPDGMYDNIGDLERELGHVGYAIALMIAEGDINDENLSKEIDTKAENISPYLNHQNQETLDELSDRT